MRLRASTLVWIFSALALLIVAAALVLTGNPGPRQDSRTALQVMPTRPSGQSPPPATRTREPAATVLRVDPPSEPSNDRVTVSLRPRLVASVRPQISNVTGVAFTVAWLSTRPSTGVIRWGLTPDRLDRVAHDTRGAEVTSEIHYVRVADLEPDIAHYFDVVTGDAVDDNSGRHYIVNTGPLLRIPGMPVILFGRVFGKDRTTQISGAVLSVVVSSSDAATAKGSQPISALTASDGSWAIELSARTADLQDYYAATAQPGFIHLRVSAGSAGAVTEVLPFDDREEPLSLTLR